MGAIEAAQPLSQTQTVSKKSPPRYKTENKQTEALVIAAQQGAKEAFNQLIRNHQSYLRSYLAGRTKYIDDVDDIAQEAFILAYQKLDTLNEPKTFQYWLCQIGLNLLKNHHRKHQRVNNESPSSLQERLQHAIDDHPADHVDASLVTLQACTRKLDLNLQQLLRAYYQDEFSIKELCQQFNVRHSTITMRLYRCRQWLRDCVSSHADRSNQ